MVPLLSCLSICSATSAFAQSSVDGAAETAADRSEIIVTARKRQESVLQVPVVTTVLSQSQLESSQVTDMNDIAALTPGLVLGLGTVEVGTQVSLRGIGTSVFDPGIDQAISLNLDGLQLTNGMAYSVGVFDMAQVEVLKGPQALFFGKNSPGGVISIRTADPGDRLEVMGRLGYEFEAREWRGEAVASGPLTEALGVRVAAMYSDFGGFFKNAAVGIPALGTTAAAPRFGKSTTLFLRGTALYDSGGPFTARLKLNYTRDRQADGAALQLVSCPDGLTNYFLGLPFYGPQEDCKGDRTLNVAYPISAAFGGLRNGGIPFTHITQKFGSLEMNYAFGENLTLTSLTGYYNLLTDASSNGTLAGASATIVADKHFTRKEFSQELRLNSDFRGPLNFTLGGFYQDGKLKNDMLLAGNTAIGLPSRLFLGAHDVATRSLSLFGQARYKAAPELEIAAGVRWTDEDRIDRPTTVDVLGQYTGVPGTVTRPSVPKLASSNWSPELTITYTPTTDLTLFASLKQGYKSGSYNLLVPVIPGQDNSFGDEKIQGGEAGIKTRIADRQVNLNLAGYFYKYSGLQTGVNLPSEQGLPVFRTLNAGAAEIYGVDFDVSYHPRNVQGLTMSAAANWNRARFTRFGGAPCAGGQTIAEGCNEVLDPSTGLFTSQDLTGTRLNRAPEWQANLSVNYELPVGAANKLKFGLSGQYSTEYSANLGRRRDFIQDAFAKLNANIAFVGANDRWEVALVGNNLTNVLRGGLCPNLNYPGGAVFPGSITGGAIRGPAGSDEILCAIDRGREVWIRLTLRPFQ
jgi:outer membrane receptor protein involved in Fe transport